MKYIVLKIKNFVSSAIFIACFPLSAEITTDGSLGNRVNLNAPDYQITQDFGKRVGDNLFYSCQVAIDCRICYLRSNSLSENILTLLKGKQQDSKGGK